MHFRDRLAAGMHPAANHFELMNEFDFFSIGTDPQAPTTFDLQDKI
jgi:hypothetical protein